jgi:succinoglycan biosynthesis transport protein ExoP
MNDQIQASQGPKEPEPETREFNLIEYARVLWKRRWLIGAVAAVFVIVAAVKTYRRTPVYEAKCTIQLEYDQANFLSFEQVLQPDSYWSQEFFGTQFKLIQSKAVAEEAAAILQKRFSESGAGAAREISLVNRVQVMQVKETRLAEVSVRDPDPEFAAEAANAICEAYINLNVRKKYDLIEQGTRFLTNEIKTLQAEIEQKEKELQTYGEQKDIVNLGERDTVAAEKLGELNMALIEATVDRLAKEASYNELRNASPDALPAGMVALNPLIQRLREEYDRISREYAKKLEVFKPDYPEMVRLRTELEGAKNSLDNEVQHLAKTAQSDYMAAVAKERTLRDAFDRQKVEASKVDSSAIAYNSLKGEIANKKSVLESLLRRQSETALSANMQGLGLSNIHIIERAEAPAAASGPSHAKNLLSGLLLGLLLGMGLALFLDFLDNSIKTPEDVARYARMPAWGIIPAFSADKPEQLTGYYPSSRKPESPSRSAPAAEAKGGPPTFEFITYRLPRSAFAERYRDVRTALLLSSPNVKSRCIAVTSSLPNEGKSATICNIGVSLAQAQKRTIIIDADLRKPRQHTIFHIPNVNGLSNYLTTKIPVRELIKPTAVPNLFIVNSGPLPPDPTVLLGSKRMASFLEGLKATFDFILLDTPPLLAVADVMTLGPKIDTLVLVILGGKTTRLTMKKSRERIQEMNVPTRGAILNRLSADIYSYSYKHYAYESKPVA